jgi:O-antigen/teichoic acid export membrane protein
MPGLLRKIFSYLNSTTSWTFLNFGLRFGSLLVVFPFVLRNVPASHLGLWYVFLTLGGFASMLDFGLSNTITRATGYLWAGARHLREEGIEEVNDDIRAVNTGPNEPLLLQLFCTARFIYTGLSLLMGGLLATLGSWWVMHKLKQEGLDASILAAWMLYVISVVWNTLGAFWGLVLIGTNEIKLTQKIGALSLILNYAVVLSSLFFNLGLYGLVLGNIVMGLCVRIVARRLFRQKMPDSLKNPPLRFYKEIADRLYPQSWRMGLYNLCSFLVSSTSTFICANHLDLKTAGSFGMTQQLMSALGSVSASWVYVKYQQINQIRVGGDVRVLRDIFFSRLRLMLVTFLTGAAVLMVGGDFLLSLIRSKTHLLPLPLLSFMLALQLLDLHANQFFNLTLSSNRNPFVKTAILSATVFLIFGNTLTPWLHLTGLLLSTLAAQCFYNYWYPVKVGLASVQMGFKDYVRLLLTDKIQLPRV